MQTNPITLKESIQQESLNLFLVDASGVIYSGGTAVPGVAETLAFMQGCGELYLLTNNSYLYPNFISERLKDRVGISINDKYIVSSGHGLAFDQTIKDTLKNNVVFSFHSDFSKGYLDDVGEIRFTTNLQEAKVLLFSAFIESEHSDMYTQAKEFVKENPDTQLICCNPDHVIASGNKNLYRVVGHYASCLQQYLTKPIMWFGKPYSNYSNLVRSCLKDNGHDHLKAVFFDDNIYNVKRLTADLSCKGVWVKDTGIQFDQEIQAKEVAVGLDLFAVSRFTLDSFIINL
jgi:ribonucleotide monophosphatase NagD (HAD superfamily)